MKLIVHLPDDPHARELLLNAQRVRIGRDPKLELTIDGNRFPKVSGLHAELVLKDGHVWLLPRSKSNSTVYNGDRIDKAMRLAVGDRFQLGFTGPEIEFAGLSRQLTAAEKANAAKLAATPKHPSSPEQESLPEQSGPAEQDGATVFAVKASEYIPAEQLASAQFSVGAGGVIGRDTVATYRLDHLHVSRRHAAIRVVDQKTVIADLGSSNGTFVDGKRISSPVAIQPGSIVDIGPFSLLFDGQNLVGRSRANNVRLDIEQLSYVVADHNTKRNIHLLNDVSFHIDPGKFIAVMGPSGSGKSTLLKIISGRVWPFSGAVGLNGRDLHKQFNALKEDLIVVPQTAAFHESLTVRQTIRFIASLRLPDDTGREELQESVSASLAKVGLQERSETRVSDLSGGQLKRLGLACELISDPSLLFLDEVTSGLDEQADGEMMQLFRGLADLGKTLVCVTHNLSHIEQFCHKIVVLTVGGRVAFYGSPEQTCEYFGVSRLADVYPILGTRRPDEWHAAFLNSPFSEEKANPDSLQNTVDGSDRNSLIERIGLKPFSQTVVLVKRYVAVWLGDYPALLAMFGQALLVTILLCLVFSSIPDASEQLNSLTRKTEIRNLLFLIGISCFWLGTNNAAKEIVKERRTYERERDFNLVPEAHWASKVLVLSLIGFLQSIFLTTIVALACDLPGNLFALIGIGMLLSFLGTNLGLAISANSKSEELAIAIVPALIIPQIVLAGVVAKLSGVSSLIAKLFTTSFWGQRLFELVLPTVERLPSDFEPAATTCLAVLGLHLAVFGTATWFGVRWLSLSRS